MSWAKSQRGGDRRFVGYEAVRRDLKVRRGCRVPDTFNEHIRRGLITFAHRNVQHQFTVALDSYKNVAVSKVLIVFGAHALFLFTDEAPQFIALHVADFHVDDLPGHDAFALFAREHQEFENRFLMNVCEANHA